MPNTNSGAHPDAGLPLLTPATKVELRSAVVGIRLRRRQEFVVADADCRFDLVCIQGSTTPQRYTLAFPTSLDSDQGTKDLRLSASINGKKAEPVRKTSWSQNSADGQTQTYQGYVFPATITRGAKQTVSVKYARQLRIQDGVASFTYILRSGAAWEGPIGRETVRIVAEPGLTIMPVETSQLRPAKQSASEITWELRDAKPTEDIRVTISVAE